MALEYRMPPPSWTNPPPGSTKAGGRHAGQIETGAVFLVAALRRTISWHGTGRADCGKCGRQLWTDGETAGLDWRAVMLLIAGLWIAVRERGSAADAKPA
jgi:hypothetical protein